MKIGIIGGGSIGLLFASYFARTNEVTIYTRTKEQSELLKRKGVSVKLNDSIQSFKIHATHSLQFISDEDIIIIAVKQYDLHNILNYFNKLEIRKTLVFLQNGMGHIESLKTLTNHNVILGVVEHGARKIDKTTVIHNGVGITKLAIFTGEVHSVRDLIKGHAQTEGFPLLLVEDWWEMLCKKLIVNAVINPLTAVLKVENGVLVQNRYYQNIMKNLYKEVISVFEIEDEEDMFRQIIQICINTSNNRSSMLTDIENGRVTEIDAILGFVLTLATKKRMELKIVSFLYHAIKGIEDRG